MGKIEVSRHDHATKFTLKTGEVHTFALKPFTVHVIELEGLHFDHDSAVLLPVEPKGTKGSDDKITPFDSLAVCLTYAGDNPTHKLIIAGHADTSGKAAYNVTLTEQRARDVLAVLMGDKPLFVSICKAKHKVKDYQRILTWIAATEGFDCDPKGVDGTHGDDTTTAIKNFQKAYNDAAIGDEITVTGSMTDATWGGFFDMYQRELLRSLGESPDDLTVLEKYRGPVQFHDPDRPAVGCGEHFPVEARGVDGFRSAENRRCELCFVEPGNDLVLDCHPAAASCKPELCRLNNPKVFEPIVVPIDTKLLPRNRCALHLQFTYLDPVAGQPDQKFPADTPITLQFDDGSTQDEKLKADGKLEAVVDRRKGHAKVAVKFGAASFFGSASPTTPAGEPKEKLGALGDLQGLLDKNYRVFQMPPETSFHNATWTGLPAGADTDGLDIDRTSIGSRDTPTVVVLDPHWQHFKFLYHDRRLLQTLSLPAMVIESFDADATGEPTARSNWLTHPEACQAVPWILQRNPDDSPRNKPDGSVTLRFRTAPRTFVDTTGGTLADRKLVTGGAPPADAVVVRGVHSDVNFDQPNATRVSFYDVPEEWQSKGQFTRLSGGTGAAPAATGDWATLAGRATTDAKPLMFRLDDMVLCDDSGGTLSVAAWAPASDRVAIFSHTFASGTNLSNIGIYKADSANNLSFLSQQVADLTHRNLIVDYPDWTRLVTLRGNLYDVFDRRVPLAAASAVGARAAVRWVESAGLAAVGSNNTAAPISSQTAVVKPFFTIHPFYNQGHHAWWTGNPTTSRRTGRFDLALLRCCGVETDGTTESALAMGYIRIAFNFNPPANPKPRTNVGPDNPPEFSPAAVPMALAAGPAAAWVDLALRNIPTRWTGPDGTHNPTTASIISRPPGGAGALSAKYLFFGQSVARATAHFEIGGFKNNPPPTPAPSVRAYMGSDRGFGVLDQGDNQSTAFFTAAHEIGHGVSLGDEYIEQVHTPGTPPPNGSYPLPWVLSFDSNQPGGPYQQDEVNAAVPGAAGMMNGNDEVRGRYLWHIAEWMRVNIGSPFDVSHNNKVYTLPPVTASNIGVVGTDDRFTLVNWPLRQTYNVSRAPHCRHDVFLYQMGHDDYADTRLPAAVRGVANPPPASVAAFDAIMIAVVRLLFAFPAGTTNAQQHTWLQSVDAGITSAYCFRWKGAGNAGAALARVLLHFSARFRAPGYAPNPLTTGIAPHITVNVVAAGAPGWTGATTFQTNRNPAGATALVNAFGDMVGLTGANTVAGSYTTLAGEVLGTPAVTAAST
jgi:hypothetical protein